MLNPSRRRFRRPALLLLLLALALTGAACTGSPRPEITSVRVTPPAVRPAATTVIEADPVPAAALTPVQPGELVVYFLDVDQGSATLLAGPDVTILIDAGRHDRAEVVPALQAIGVETIDLLVGTHPHADHIGQFPAVLAAFPVTEVWLSGNSHSTLTFEQALDAMLASEAAYHEPRAGESYQLGSVQLAILHPDQLTGELNDDSIVLRVTFGQIAFLFPGDAEAAAEAAMVAEPADMRAQILQLGHHGSSTSSTLAFLQAVQPAVAIYSAGRGNSYGHPHTEVVERVAALGIPLYGTDTNGTIQVVTDGSSYRVVAAGLPLGGLPAAPAMPTPLPTAEPPGAEAGCRPGQVNVNSADRAELDRIIHIGPERAGQIVRLRPFVSVEDLIRINGIGPVRLREIIEQGLACVE
jgi:competence protein ComEC